MPFECMDLRFMQKAFLGLMILAPITAIMGVHVVNYRMAFFADAISHSVFTGVALGVIFSVNPHWTIPLFGILVGVSIVACQRNSLLSNDTIIGVIFSAVLAFGLAIVSRDSSMGRNLKAFIYGDILTINDANIAALSILGIAILVFQILGFNRLLYLGINPVLAKAHGVNVAVYQYVFISLLSLVVVFSVSAIGIMLVTALLTVPAAAARNLSHSSGSMVWWAILISSTSTAIGLIISAQTWAQTATGPTIVIVAFAWFIIPLIVRTLSRFRKLS